MKEWQNTLAKIQWEMAIVGNLKKGFCGLTRLNLNYFDENRILDRVIQIIANQPEDVSPVIEHGGGSTIL